jgi:hypothetical protein
MRRIILLWTGCILVSAMTAAAATGTHIEGSTLYPRLIRLRYAPHSLKGTLLAKTGNRLYRSTDEGHTFTYLASVGSADGSKERCCSTVYELPRKMGKLRAGTLLYSGSFFAGDVPAIEIYTSIDEGAHWKYLTTPVKAGDKHHGLWEPEFTTARDGSLVMYFSDETDACCSQKLAQMRTRDGMHWSAKQDTVASSSQKDRPGMAVITRLPDKTYFMSYEICGPVAHCQVYFRHSADGWNFGDAADFGIKAVTAAGQYFAHAPANIFDPVSGQILLVGQVLYEADGSVSGQNGRLLFTRSVSDGDGAWGTRPAPVAIPTAYDNYCPNYSSALMPVQGGLLELASDYDDSHKCTSYVAILPIR